MLQEEQPQGEQLTSGTNSTHANGHANDLCAVGRMRRRRLKNALTSFLQRANWENSPPGTSQHFAPADDLLPGGHQTHRHRLVLAPVCAEEELDADLCRLVASFDQCVDRLRPVP